MITCCTIITSDYLPLARVLQASLYAHAPQASLKILVTDKDLTASGTEFLSVAQLSNGPFAREIEQKYAHTNPDIFRWALKPVLTGHLLREGHAKVICLDADLYFTGDYSFLESLLDEYSILLTPHWADLDVINSEDSVLSVLRNGMFNAGFFAAGRSGLPAVEWWAGMCHYKIERRQDLGIYDDQKYLDLLPVQFEGVHILRHTGCNLASWNIHQCRREMINGSLKINGTYDPVFIHFARDTISNILNRNDVLLKPYLDEYVSLLKKEGFDLPALADKKQTGLFHSPAYKIKHAIRLRTRLKRWLFKLAEKL